MIKLSAKPNFKHCNIFSEDLVAIHKKKTELKFNSLTLIWILDIKFTTFPVNISISS